MKIYTQYIIIFSAILLFKNCPAQNESSTISDTTGNDFFYYLNTNPYNATVIYKDSSLGITPLRFYSSKKLEGNLIIKKNGFKDFILSLNNYNFENGFQTNLEKINNFNIIEKDRESHFKTRKEFIFIGSAGFLTLLSGYTSVVFKNIANDSYDSYQNSLNPSDLNKSNRYDIYSGIALAVMQASFIGLIYLLFFK